MRRALLPILAMLSLHLSYARLAMQQDNPCDGVPNIGVGRWVGSMDDLIGGFCLDGYVSPGLPTYSFWNTQIPQNSITRALYQSPGVLEETAALLGFDGTEDYINLMSPSMSGAHVFIQFPDNATWIPVRNVSGVMREHLDHHYRVLRSGLELSYALAERHGVIDYWNDELDERYPQVRICIANEAPEVLCAGEPQKLTEWYEREARFVGDLTLAGAWERFYQR